MKHNAAWFSLMFAAVFLLLVATGNAQVMFFASLIGLLGAAVANRQHVNRLTVMAGTIASGVAFAVAVVMVLLHHR